MRDEWAVAPDGIVPALDKCKYIQPWPTSECNLTSSTCPTRLRWFLARRMISCFYLGRVVNGLS